MTNNDKQPAGDERLEQRSREMFDASVAGLDAHTRSRLNQARQAALDAMRERPAGSMPRFTTWLLPVGTAAALGLVTLTAVQFMRSGDDTSMQQATVASADDLEIIASSEELEMLKDVEFYAWLETQPEAAADTGEAG